MQIRRDNDLLRTIRATQKKYRYKVLLTKACKLFVSKQRATNESRAILQV